MDTTDSQENIKKIIDDNKIVLFMKGTPSSPMCGLSANVVMILKEIGIRDFKTVDVLRDFSIREGIKVFSDWPTIPQLYFQGEFIGGNEIIQEMYNSKELQGRLTLGAS